MFFSIPFLAHRSNDSLFSLSYAVFFGRSLKKVVDKGQSALYLDSYRYRVAECGQALDEKHYGSPLKKSLFVCVDVCLSAREYYMARYYFRDVLGKFWVISSALLFNTDDLRMCNLNFF